MRRIVQNYLGKPDEPLYRTTGRIYDLLWKRVPEKNWKMALLKSRFEPREYDFIVVSMYYGIRSNGGSTHAITTFLDDLDEVIACCRHIGANRTASKLKWGRKRLEELGFSRLRKRDRDKAVTPGEAFEKEYEDRVEESDNELDVLLYSCFIKGESDR